MAGIRKRGNSFTITAYMGYDCNGKQIKKTTTYKPPEGVTPAKAYKMAKAFAVSWEEEITGMVTLDENKTVLELIEWYYCAVAPKILKPNILKENKSDLLNHVVPIIGKEKLRNVTPAKLDIMTETIKNDNLRSGWLKLKDGAFDNVGIYKLARSHKDISISAYYRLKRGECCRKRTGEILAEALNKPIDELFIVQKQSDMKGTSINKIMGILSSVFNVAVKKGIMRKNPCDNITKLKNDASEVEYLNEEQSRELLRLISAREDIQFVVLINLLISSGMRIGEALAMHWNDIDFKEGTVFIRYTLARYDGEWKRQSPKTKGSIRKILLPKQIINQLKTLNDGYGGTGEAPVFASKNGRYLWPGDINRRLKACISESSLPKIHTHSLRHTSASILINNHIPIKAISERLGHSQTRTTLEVYSHMFEEADREASNTIESVLFGEENADFEA